MCSVEALLSCRLTGRGLGSWRWSYTIRHLPLFSREKVFFLQFWAKYLTCVPTLCHSLKPSVKRSGHRTAGTATFLSRSVHVVWQGQRSAAFFKDVSKRSGSAWCRISHDKSPASKSSLFTRRRNANFKNKRKPSTQQTNASPSGQHQPTGTARVSGQAEGAGESGGLRRDALPGSGQLSSSSGFHRQKQQYKGEAGWLMSLSWAQLVTWARHAWESKRPAGGAPGILRLRWPWQDGEEGHGARCCLRPRGRPAYRAGSEGREDPVWIPCSWG